MALQSWAAGTGFAPQGGGGGCTIIPTFSLHWPCRRGESRQGRSSVLCGKELGFSGEQCRRDGASDPRWFLAGQWGRQRAQHPAAAPGALSSSKSSSWLWQLIPPVTSAACSPQCPARPLGTLPAGVLARAPGRGRPRCFPGTHTPARDTSVCWCVGRAGLAAAGHSHVPCLAAPPRPCCPPRPAIPGRESRMGTVFFHFKVSRGAVWTHRPFVQPLRVPPAVILLKFMCDLRRLCLVGEDPC